MKYILLFIIVLFSFGVGMHAHMLLTVQNVYTQEQVDALVSDEARWWMDAHDRVMAQYVTGNEVDAYGLEKVMEGRVR